MPTDNMLTWDQPSLRQRIVWNFTRHEITHLWRPQPRGELQTISTVQYADDTSAWHYIVDLMTKDNARIGAQDWTAV